MKKLKPNISIDKAKILLGGKTFESVVKSTNPRDPESVKRYKLIRATIIGFKIMTEEDIEKIEKKYHRKIENE